MGKPARMFLQEQIKDIIIIITVPMTSDVTLEGSGVREGSCSLGVKA